MCVRILQSASQVNSEEWQFFLKGGQVLDRSQQPANPGPAWLSDLAWDSITELDHLPNFKVSWTAFWTWCPIICLLSRCHAVQTILQGLLTYRGFRRACNMSLFGLLPSAQISAVLQ